MEMFKHEEPTLKKTFTLNLDAAIIITVLFIATLGLNLVQYLNYKSLLKENFQLQMQALEDQLNLDSRQHYIDKLKKQLEPLEQTKH